jgi:hypothetical protein
MAAEAQCNKLTTIVFEEFPVSWKCIVSYPDYILLPKTNLLINPIHPMAHAAQRVKLKICKVRLNGSIHAPLNNAGRPGTALSIIVEALRQHLLERPDLCAGNMMIFAGRVHCLSRKSSSSLVLAPKHYSGKTARQTARRTQARMLKFLHLF